MKLKIEDYKKKIIREGKKILIIIFLFKVFIVASQIKPSLEEISNINKGVLLDNVLSKNISDNKNTIFDGIMINITNGVLITVKKNGKTIITIPTKDDEVDFNAYYFSAKKSKAIKVLFLEALADIGTARYYLMIFKNDILITTL